MKGTNALAYFAGVPETKEKKVLKNWKIRLKASTNALAYFARMAVTKKKKFYVTDSRSWLLFHKLEIMAGSEGL